MFHKRKNNLISVLIILILSCTFSSACKKPIPPISETGIFADFSVNFLDVGQGDCIFIRLPDGKNALIDCGINDSLNKNSKYVKQFLVEYEAETIDYFILTHPDVDHIGNAEMILDNFKINALYLPYLEQDLYPLYKEYETVVKKADQKNINKIISDYSCFIKSSDYVFAFLSPSPRGIIDSSYDNLIGINIPSEKDMNNLSPIIYFECFGKRFLFTGDAEKEQELLVVQKYNVGFYDLLFYDKNIQINLEDIDYLKLSHHGSSDASCNEFLSLVRPKNVIISVGNENYYGHPKSETLERLLSICPNHNLYRTDQMGTISIHRENGQFKIN